jgi:hypothetical protein
MRHVMIGLAPVRSLVMVAAAESRKPDATLSLLEGSVAAGVGFSWGNGDAEPGRGSRCGACRERIGEHRT